MGNGKHTDTGRQRSEPEEGKHARQPEGPTGERRGPPTETCWGGTDQMRVALWR